jgi:hypothetical protein
MNSDQERRRSLFEIEAQIMEEGREWTRRRLQEELQKEAERDGGIFPPQRPKAKTSAAGADATAHRRGRR